MRFFHLSDLHIGKQLHHYSLLKDQKHILDEVIAYVNQYTPDAVVIAGDIYDKTVPSAEAVALFDEFLTQLSDITPSVKVLLISGNHDSAQRLDYASHILGRQDIYIAGKAPGNKTEHLKKVTLTDDYGEVDFYLLPFLKPGYVRGVFEEAEKPETYNDAVRMLLEREDIDREKRNVLVSHQFYVNLGQVKSQKGYVPNLPKTCDSETFSVGGIDYVDILPLMDFDYAALGHLHGAQQAGAPFIRYCGTLLKYSVSEVGHNKSLHMIELGAKGEAARVIQLPLHPLRDVRKVRGELVRILENAKPDNREDYISVTLTDEVDPYRPKEQLEKVYPNILEVRLDNARTRKRLEEFGENVKSADPLSVFLDFFQEIQGREMSEEEKEYVGNILDKVKEE